jgi:D-alanyl-D-alanine carboxypeptidase
MSGLVGVLALGWVLLGGFGLGPAGPGPGRAQASDPRDDPPYQPSKPLSSIAPRVPALRLGGANDLRVDFGSTPPASGLLFDLRTGRVFWHRDARVPRPIASTTKIMSALIAVDELRPSHRVMIHRDVRDFSGSAVGLPHGKRIKVEALLAAMLVQSGNDAALALATAAEGSVPRFVAEMNRRARRLGLACTHYVSPHGLEPGNRSCAADLAVLAQLAMRQDRITRIVRKAGATVSWPIKGGKLSLAPTNPLLIDGYPGTIGLKTGFTDAAGMCIVAVVQRGDRTLGLVLLDSPDSGRQSEKLFDAAFRQRPWTRAG